MKACKPPSPASWAGPRRAAPLPSPEQFLHVYDGHEHRLERTPPHQRFADITRESLRLTMRELGMAYRPEDADTLIGGISAMPPFPKSWTRWAR